MIDAREFNPDFDFVLVAAIREGSNNDLSVVVVEGKAGEPVPTMFGPASPIGPQKTSRAFALTWWEYVAYGVRNESFFKWEDGETLQSRWFGTRTDSAYLRYVADSTFATDHYPGGLTHWFLYGSHHCIDVVATQPPEIVEVPIDQVCWGIGSRDN